VKIMKHQMRSLHLIDIENQLGSGHIRAREVSEFFGYYEATVGVGSLDQIVVAVSSCDALLELPRSALRACRLLYKPGHDGADMALQDVILHEDVSARFGTVVCASGDGGFVEAVSQLTARGTRVVIAAPRMSSSRRLRMAAHQTIELDFDYIKKDAA
jgi:hypothetical protein